MTHPLCSRCPRPAHWDLREGLLCVHCGTLALTRNMIAEMERCIIPGSAEAFSADRATAGVSAGAPASAVAAISTPSDGRDSSDVKPAASVPSAPEGAAGNSFDGLPIFPERKKATASRVIASRTTQAPNSSSDIPQIHHQ